MLPVLLKPRPTLDLGGQVVSIGPVYSDFWSEGAAAPLFNTCIFLSEGDCGSSVCNDVVNLSQGLRRRNRGGPNSKKLKPHLAFRPW